MCTAGNRLALVCHVFKEVNAPPNVAISFDRFSGFPRSNEIETHMTEPPGWLKELADAAAVLMMPADAIAPIGCHYFCVASTWEISLFAAGTEIVGGASDGQVRRSRFCLDIEEIRNLFAEIESVTWQVHALAFDDELGPHVEVHGRYADKDVKLRILAYPPKRFAAGRRAIVYEQAWEETW